MASFKKLKTGWQYRVSYKDGNGYKTKSQNGFKTKKEAELAAAKVEDLLSKGNKINHDIEFVEYFQRWYEVFKKDKHSERNNRDIQLAINTAKKFFKNTQILKIDRALYQNFINWYGNGRATASVRKVHIYTKACLLDALQDGVIHKDPTWNVLVKGTEEKQDERLKYLNEKEVLLLIKDLKKNLDPKHHSKYAILLALATGMRFSEVIALSWEDVDFQNQTLNIDKSFDYTITKKLKEPKTPSSIRKISLDDDTIQLLKEFKFANQINQSGYLFLDKQWNHVSNTACNKALRVACKRAGITNIHFHSLRHTHCSLLLYKGVNIKFISKRLGHSSTAITYKVYSHVLDEMEDQESEKINDIMENLYNAN